jgi:rubrerythrin
MEEVMSKQAMINALAQGIKGELDGITVYENAAEKSTGEVRTFFLDRAGEEKQHYNWLVDYYQRLVNEDGVLEPGADRGRLPDEASPIISESFLERIGKDQYLSTAVSTSVLLEMNAIEHYRKSAEDADDKAVKQLFNELVEWEKGHYDMLLKIQEESRKVWFETQGFEPY